MNYTPKSESALALRQALLAQPDMPFEDIPISRLGITVRVRGMTVAQQSEYEAGFFKKMRKRDGTTALEQNDSATLTSKQRLVVLTAIDPESGELLFGPDDVVALGKTSSQDLALLVEAARRVNGMSRADMEELEKNLEETDAAALASVSQ